MRKNVRDAMDALFSGEEYTNQSIQTRQDGVFWVTVGNAGFYLPTVYSYGSHFPLVMLTPEGDTAYVNQDKYSVTTSHQQSGVALYLYYEGYRQNGKTVEHHGHTYAVYVKNEPESWPGFNYATQRPVHHGGNESCE